MSEVSDIRQEDWALWRAFMSMSQQLARALDRQLQRDAGISQADYGVLLVLFESAGKRLRPGEMGELLAWEKSRVSHQVSRMESRGLVERQECDTDLRGTWIAITADGRRALLGAMRQHAETIRELFLDQLEPDQRTAIHSASLRVLEALNPEACDLTRDVAGAESEDNALQTAG